MSQLGKKIFSKKVSRLRPSDEVQHLREELELHEMEREQQTREFIQQRHQLDASHDPYVDLYEFAPVFYVTLSAQGIILNINLKGGLLLNDGELHLIGRPLADFVVAEDRPALQNHLARCARSTGELISELRLLTCQRGEVPMQLTSISVQHAKWGIPIFPTALIDLTERKKIERDLVRREQELHRAHQLEAIGRLAGGIAHDFNNMLAGIQGLTDEIRENLPPQDPRLENVEEIMRICQRAFNLNRQLLTFGRKQVSRPIALDLNNVVVNMEKLLRSIIGEDIRLELDLIGDLRAIRADESQIEQIILNLVANARDAMPLGGRISIRTSNDSLASQESGSVVLEVKDNGIGMNDETRARLFEPFFSRKQTGQGTGLGLATVHAIVQQSGGDIRVDTKPGEGSRFEIHFPAVDETPRPERRSRRPEVSAVDATILLVEDEAIVRRVAEKLLKQKGYKVLTAENAEEALKISRGTLTPIHLLLTDVIMPGLNGNQLASLLRQERSGIQVLFMSGYPEDHISRQGVLDPGVEFIEKSQISRNLVYRVGALLTAASTKPAA